jgi:hypothetical protein
MKRAGDGEEVSNLSLVPRKEGGGRALEMHEDNRKIFL